MNCFYEIAKVWQWIIAILLFLGSMTTMLVGVLYSPNFVVSMLIILLLMPLIQFCNTPILRLAGIYQYLSPMLLAYAPSEQKYDLHSGTTFDYLFVMRGTPAGMPVRTKLLAYFIEGLLQIVEKVEQGELPDNIEVSGTSYFITEQMAERLGFERTKLSIGLTVNLWANIIDLTALYSYAQGRLSWPPLRKATSIISTGGKLLGHKEELQTQLQRLQARQAQEHG